MIQSKSADRFKYVYNSQTICMYLLPLKERTVGLGDEGTGNERSFKIHGPTRNDVAQHLMAGVFIQFILVLKQALTCATYMYPYAFWCYLSPRDRRVKCCTFIDECQAGEFNGTQTHHNYVYDFWYVEVVNRAYDPIPHFHTCVLIFLLKKYLEIHKIPEIDLYRSWNVANWSPVQ